MPKIIPIHFVDPDDPFGLGQGKLVVGVPLLTLCGVRDPERAVLWRARKVMGVTCRRCRRALAQRES